MLGTGAAGRGSAPRDRARVRRELRGLRSAINGLYKAEVIHRRASWRSFEAVEFATLTWVDWFNHRRLLEPIGNIPPAEAEERYYAMLGETAMAA
ncbi:transposase InsO family protein [Ancylobacter polymorphus]|uniref:Transposase InsO family protein n=1 Tax=Ancylobacter polymorphus TaxID=223390 RepID=A0ABU0BDA1_9HYPH|nr:transposase InsO family protein [Ancylobacter polymorphus]